MADLTALRLTLGRELADDLPRQGRFGTGVLVAPLSSAIGLDADVVFVVGLAEELVPGRLREDALLPERVRALAPGQLAPWRDRLDRQHRQLLAALDAPDRIVSFPEVTCAEASVRLRRKRNGNPPGAAFCSACSISRDGTRQRSGG